MTKVMNRIGIVLGLLAIALTLNTSCQNFFWSHTGETEPTSELCVEYGLLYNGYVVDDARKITSSDSWNLPTSTQFTSMYNYHSSGIGLKDDEAGYWLTNNGTNEYGITMRGSGWRRTTGSFENLLSAANFWEFNGGRNTLTDAGVADYFGEFDKTGMAVRLVSDATGIPDGTTTTYTGNDGHIYNAVAINELYWTTENLIETEYRNGDPIPIVEDNTTWAGLTTGAACAYDNTYTNVGCDFTP